ncbi:MAG: Holliday junction resolvase RuvX, partial [Clostridia bacterium]|nr:Holliday junction resolvase RuvX [Clostridia bacterium]
MKIIGIDLGDHRTGVAYSDILGMMSTRAETITEYNREKLLNKILEIIKLEKPERIVLGLPVNMNGTEGERAEMSRAFAE